MINSTCAHKIQSHQQRCIHLLHKYISSSAILSTHCSSYLRRFSFLEHPMLHYYPKPFWTSGFIFLYFLCPWLFVWSTFFTFKSNSAFHISETTSFALQCKLTPNPVIPIQNGLFIPLISTSKQVF